MFISIAMPLAGEMRVRPYTIASTPEAGEPFEIVFNRVPDGIGTEWLFARKVGDEFDFTGPFGAFTIDRAPAVATVFVAEGTGIAPIRPMLHRVLAAETSTRVDLLYVADQPAHLIYRAELETLAHNHHPRFQSATLITSSPIWDLVHEEVWRRWIDSDSDRTRQFYICGVGAGVIALRDLLRNAGYERRAVHYEKW